ncbi:MAG TPA: hypothetical protein VFY25_14495 [Anaerolineales bacterium]|nr:hypothetical protein [Anaerolineales bacterium]
MPTLTRWFLKIALLYLILALCVGILLAVPGESPLLGLFAIYIHTLVFGWLTQLIFGVALWMFPKYSADRPRGYEWLGWATLISLNLGLVLRIIFEPLQSIGPSPASGSMLVLSAVLQWLSGVTFVVNTWARVREK